VQATKEEESLPPWIRGERERKLAETEGSDLPFPVYLLGSALVAIAAVGLPMLHTQDSCESPFPCLLCLLCSRVKTPSKFERKGEHQLNVCVGWQVGSIFEFANRNPIFGVLPPDNFLWAPILLFFSITGFPSAGACPQSLVPMPLCLHNSQTTPSSLTLSKMWKLSCNTVSGKTPSFRCPIRILRALYQD
jgi:hypothetical protein